MYNISKILVPVDFSNCSRAALDLAVSLAAKYDAKVDVLHVSEVPRWPREPRVRAAGEEMSVKEYALKVAREQFDGFLGALPDADRRRLEPVVVVGSPRESIVERAKDGYDLVVMGTHGRIGRAHLLAGSLAESVVRTAPCPVLTAREKD